MKRSGDRGIARDRVIGKTTIPAVFSVSPCLRGEIRTPIPRSPDHSIYRSLVKLLRDVTLVVTAALREIFDESAYDRFLARTQTARSVESYRQFMQERETGMARKPRCC
jgi:hypothetical protein